MARLSQNQKGGHSGRDGALEPAESSGRAFFEFILAAKVSTAAPGAQDLLTAAGLRPVPC